MSTAPDQDETTLRKLEDAAADPSAARYDLSLFVNGASALSARAVTNVRAICDEHLHGRHQLHVVDVYRYPAFVASRGVLASPTLIKDHPLPKRVLVGDMSDTSHVLLALDIVPAEQPRPGPV